MSCGSKTIHCGRAGRRPAGFTLIEAITALGVLAVIVTGVLVALNRSLAAMVDNRSRVMAFELARENMEKLLGTDSVTDMSEFGVHELDEDIEWENKIESFTEPVKSTMWIRAVCSASYTDRSGERQKVELTHWITDLTKAQEKQILDQKRREQEFLEEMDGNPFGDDPDGLMQYAEALAEMGDYERAAEAASELILNYPGEPQAAAAWSDLLKYPERALAQGDATTAETILDIIVTDHADRPEVQKTVGKIRKAIDSGQFVGAASGGRQGTNSGTSSQGGSTEAGSRGGTGSGSGTGKNTNTSSGAGSGGGTGSGSGSRYPNPNWTDEQKRIWDMFMNMQRGGQ